MWGVHNISGGVNYSAISTSNGFQNDTMCNNAISSTDGCGFGSDYQAQYGQSWGGDFNSIHNYPGLPGATSTANTGTLNNIIYKSIFEIEYRIRSGNADTASTYSQSGTPGNWGSWRNLMDLSLIHI